MVCAISNRQHDRLRTIHNIRQDLFAKSCQFGLRLTGSTLQRRKEVSTMCVFAVREGWSNMCSCVAHLRCCCWLSRQWLPHLVAQEQRLITCSSLGVSLTASV